jgi:hypothetical protein
MTYKVQVIGSTTNVRVIKTTSNPKATVASGVTMARTLEELLDVDLSDVSDKYVIMYDASTQKYTAVNPDEVLSAAVAEQTSPGLPTNFKDQLDADLDDRIDIDGGTW